MIAPGALPGVLAGFRISSSIALSLVVAAAMTGTQVGIGAFVLTAGNLMQTDQLIAGVVVLSLLGLGTSGLIAAVIAVAWSVAAARSIGSDQRNALPTLGS